jgi:hypothetical protein
MWSPPTIAYCVFGNSDTGAERNDKLAITRSELPAPAHEVAQLHGDGGDVDAVGVHDHFVATR